jgi:hypothetical protein
VVNWDLGWEVKLQREFVACKLWLVSLCVDRSISTRKYPGPSGRKAVSINSCRYSALNNEVRTLLHSYDSIASACSELKMIQMIKEKILS